MTWSFNTLNNEMGEDLMTAAGCQTSDSFITDAASSSSADKTALIPFTQREDSMDIAATSDDHTAMAPSIQKEESVDIASTFEDHAVLAPFSHEKPSMDIASTSNDHPTLAPFTQKEESMDIVSNSEDHTAFSHERPIMDMADIPAAEKSETSLITDLAARKDFLSIDDPTHVGMLAFASSEIRHMIYKFAMTADDGRFLFNDQTTPFKPNVATGLLRVNHAIYHEIRDYLYSQNNFHFTGCGSDLRIITRPHDASRYGETISSTKLMVPSFNKVIIELGDAQSAEVGEFKTNRFMAALSGLRNEVGINHLTLLLGQNCLVPAPGPIHLANALGMLKVRGSLEMMGLDAYLLTDVRAIPRALGMNIQPVWSKLYRCDQCLDTRGIFSSTYVPATCREEAELQAGQTVWDAGVEYYARLMAPPEDAGDGVEEGWLVRTLGPA